MDKDDWSFGESWTVDPSDPTWTGTQTAVKEKQIEEWDDETLVLGIETSCDETSASVVRGGREILSNVIASQTELHGEYGGIVPEAAARAHVEALTPAIREALLAGGRNLLGPGCRCSDAGPRSDRFAARRGRRGQGHRLGSGHPVRGREPSGSAHLLELPRQPGGEVAGGGAAHLRRSHDARPRPGARRLRDARRNAGRRCRRGVRQGGALPRPRLSGGAGDRPAVAARETRTRFGFLAAWSANRVSTSATRA